MVFAQKIFTNSQLNQNSRWKYKANCFEQVKIINIYVYLQFWTLFSNFGDNLNVVISTNHRQINFILTYQPISLCSKSNWKLQVKQIHKIEWGFFTWNMSSFIWHDAAQIYWREYCQKVVQSNFDVDFHNKYLIGI